MPCAGRVTEASPVILAWVSTTIARIERQVGLGQKLHLGTFGGSIQKGGGGGGDSGARIGDGVARANAFNVMASLASRSISEDDMMLPVRKKVIGPATGGDSSGPLFRGLQRVRGLIGFDQGQGVGSGFVS